MNARARIEKLSHGWYGLAVFSAVLQPFVIGFGAFSITGTIFSLLFSFLVTFFITRKLLARSSGMRLFALVCSSLGVLFGALAGFGVATHLMHQFTFAALAQLAMTGGAVWMNARSVHTLTSGNVRAYFAR